jgi:hypothetical protein
LFFAFPNSGTIQRLSLYTTVRPLGVVVLVTQATYLISSSLLFLPGAKPKSFAVGTALLTSVLFLALYDGFIVLLTVSGVLFFSSKGWGLAFFLLSWLLTPAHVLVIAGSWRLLKRIDVNASFIACEIRSWRYSTNQLLHTELWRFEGRIASGQQST